MIFHAQATRRLLILHWLKLDPKIAAGPVSLALTDIFTLLFYFGLAALLL
jgi:magnesium transporter